MLRTDSDEDAGFPDFEPAEAVRHRHAMNRKFLMHLFRNFADFSKRHRFVRFVIEIKRATAVRVVADAAVKRYHRAVLRLANVLHKRLMVNRVAHQEQQIELRGIWHKGTR